MLLIALFVLLDIRPFKVLVLNALLESTLKLKVPSIVVLVLPALILMELAFQVAIAALLVHQQQLKERVYVLIVKLEVILQFMVQVSVRHVELGHIRMLRAELSVLHAIKAVIQMLWASLFVNCAAPVRFRLR